MKNVAPYDAEERFFKILLAKDKKLNVLSPVRIRVTTSILFGKTICFSINKIFRHFNKKR